MIHLIKRHLSGFRMSVAIAIILLVAAEMIGLLVAAEMIGPEFGVGAYILLAGSLVAIEKS